MPWFDAGVNLLDRRFDAHEVVMRAVDAGVEKLCVITTHPNEWAAAEQLYSAFPQHICYTIGVHPHNAKVVREEDLRQLKIHAAKPGVVAIGECGLDFNRDFSPRPTQIAVFEAQLAIAKAMQLPVYLHERDAFDAQRHSLNKFISHIPGGIAQCFTGDSEQLGEYLAMGLYIGITGWACDEKRGEALRQAIPHIPLENIILETDAPYLFPKTLRPRKKNNEPAFLPHIGEKVSELMQVSPDKLRICSYANTCRLFSLMS